MGERKGQQKYYPPDWRPEHGSLDNYYGTHPLRDRARKLDRGILIIRFEMPFNIWCDGCNNHIGMGVRYNAEKTKVGMYYSTPIYKFSMKCVYCPSIIQIQTDPKNCDYTVMSGARRVNNRWKAEDAEQIEAVEYNEKQRLRNDAMFNLDYGHKDKTKAAKEIPTLAEIYHTQDSNWKDVHTANSVLRKKFREEKKQILANEKADEEISDKLNLNFDLVPKTESDEIEAKQTFLIESSSKLSVPTVASKKLGVKLSAQSQKLRVIKRSLNVSLSKKVKLIKDPSSVFRSASLTNLVAIKPKSKSSIKKTAASSISDLQETSRNDVLGDTRSLTNSDTKTINQNNSSSSLLSLAGNYSDSNEDPD
ncbi:probable splicing factor YJU2B [Symsagittifera roscoffensis]|uniref:probable splicing factor YJU2B n=1 Tax=Symsagittifera roscoffensis TaxID=84072 RepID=UPI00307BDDA7